MRSLKYLATVSMLKASGFKKICQLTEPELKEKIARFKRFGDSAPDVLTEKKYNIIKKTIGQQSYYIIRPRKQFADRAVLYIHGGALFMEITMPQWHFAGRLAEALQCAVYVPIYPLLPEHTYKETFSFITGLYEILLSRYSIQDISLIGDSCGGGITLGCAQHFKKLGLPAPTDIVLISPAISGIYPTPENREEVEMIAKHDPVLSPELFSIVPKWWADGLDLQSYFVSPLYGELNDIGKISIFTGTYDILYPQARELHERLHDEAIEHNYFVGDKLIHVYAIFSCPEGDTAMRQIEKILT